jgi:hypothetical protein
MTGHSKRIAGFIAALATSPSGAVQDYETAPYRSISGSECISIDRLRPQFESIPPNHTFVHVFGQGNGGEFVGFHNALTFSTSPLTDLSASGAPRRYSTKSTYSRGLHNQCAWSGERFLRVHVPWARLINIVSDIRALYPATHGSMSLNPADYTLEEAGILYELMVGMSNDRNVAIGTSLRYFEVYEAFDY